MTSKQSRFVAEYCLCLNAAESARRAGYSPHSARSQGCENLTKPYIRAAIDERLSRQAMSRSEALARLAAIARFCLLDYTRPDGSLDVRRLMASGSQAVTGVKQSPHGPQFSTSEPLQALLHVCKAHGLFKDTIGHEVAGSITINLHPLEA